MFVGDRSTWRLRIHLPQKANYSFAFAHVSKRTFDFALDTHKLACELFARIWDVSGPMGGVLMAGLTDRG